MMLDGYPTKTTRALAIKQLERRRNFLIAEDAQGRANNWEKAEISALGIAIGDMKDLEQGIVQIQPR